MNAVVSLILTSYLEGVLMVGGHVPILAGDEVIGAIGVAGSPGSIHDEECADIALHKSSGGRRKGWHSENVSQTRGERPVGHAPRTKRIK